MQKSKLILTIICGLFLSVNNYSQSISEFQHPSIQYQPRTWWRWLGGNISKEGISKDLEEIKAKGMNGVTLFNLGTYYPEGNVKFMSEQWLELFNFSISECARLGLDFSFQMCDGWGASGGPWVSKDHAMKVITSSKTTVIGGKKLSIPLVQPFTRLDYYKDIKVFAFPARDISKRNFNQANVKVRFGGWCIDSIKLIDGERYSEVNFGYNRGQDQVIDFEIINPFPVSTVNVYQASRESPTGPRKIEVQYSTDGVNYQPIGSFDLKDIKGGITFKEVTAKYYRLRILRWYSGANRGNWAFLSEVEFLSKENKSTFPMLTDFEMKASSWHRRREYDRSEKVSSEYFVKKDQILDITDYYKNGTLNWNAPAGNWTIVRIGYTLTGRENGPATKEGTGLECDKLSKESVKIFYDGYAGKLLKMNKQYCGNTISRLFADSFEALAQNWTPSMEMEFKNRNGYDLSTWLLALSGEIIDNTEETELFLLDYRRTISDMLAENYYKELNSLCHADNVKFVAQTAGEQQMLINPILYSSMVDIPSTEFWIAGKNENAYYHPNGSVYDVISAAHIYGHKIIPTEAFTMNWSDFSVTPVTLKAIADKAFCYGFNQFEMHTYIHQPDNKMPGWQHYMFGIAWGRKVTWWEQAGELTKYFSRIQSILQEGQPVADILLFTGEQIPNSIEMTYGTDDPYTIIPKGYSFDACNKQVLVDMIDFKNGAFVLPNGLKYKILVLPSETHYSIKTLEKLQSLIEKGGLVFGPKPQLSSGLGARNDERFKAIVQQVWGNCDGFQVTSHNYGQGRVYDGIKLIDVLKKENILPDFSFQSNIENANVMYQHKTIGKNEIYFISNQSGKNITIDASFRQSGLIPEIWDPQTGKTMKQPIVVNRNKGISMPFMLNKDQSLFIVFTEGKDIVINEIKKDGITLYPFATSVTTLPFSFYDNQNLSFTQSGKYSLMKSDGKILTIEAKPILPLEIVQGAWNVNFDSAWGAPSSTKFDSLISWTLHSNEGIKFYSGTGRYSKNIMVDKKWINADQRIVLNLGNVRETAVVYINGKKVSTFIFSGIQCDISDYVKAGTNLLEIEVTNTWNNRIAGDDLSFSEKRFTDYPVKGYKDDMKRRHYGERDILESGIMGPVTIEVKRLYKF